MKSDLHSLSSLPSPLLPSDLLFPRDIVLIISLIVLVAWQDAEVILLLLLSELR
jgi:hypothetical protein